MQTAKCENPKCRMTFRVKAHAAFDPECPFCGWSKDNPEPSAAPSTALPARAPVEGPQHDEAES